jgi:hypothetical protein
MSGRDKEFESDDPMELVGMVIDTQEDTLEEMGRVFVEEFARMGCTDRDILRLFRDPFYRAPHALYAAKGEEYVTTVIKRVRASSVE